MYKGDMGIAVTPPRNRMSKWQPHRNWCLAWLILCQFPIPIAHSHDSLAVLNPVAWQEHLRTHHPELNALDGDFSAGCLNCSGEADRVHWHLMLPWELSLSGGADPSHQSVPLVASPLGLWGGTAGVDNATTVGVTVAASALEPKLDLCWLERWNVVGEGRSDLANFAGRGGTRCLCPSLEISFAQTYLGVSLRTLIGVCLV